MEHTIKCIDVCYKTLKMMLEAGANKQGLCEDDTSGVNHNELERRLESYKLIKINNYNELLAACKYAIEKLRDVKGKAFPVLPILQAIAKAENKE
ncbi:MAG: hypothetical protein MUO31_06685 [Thermodesulfovibrionales bacterium]|nr:hypothetical protein [Thermodesulfovibrionales bacterium]